MKKTIVDYEEKYYELEKELINFKQKTFTYLDALNDALDQNRQKEEMISQKNKELTKLKSKISKLESELLITQKKLSAMQNSKLGKLTTKYWKLRKSVTKGV
ncbi:hypothetical protein B0G93_12712 [Bacillus sp. V-88]|nr:hypothetical protein B1B00_18675 [Bacillus sp. DSM 27956]PRX70884.1 hypothetical protein B0G93_12712 [Bacillus sp. V-88]SLK24554.1 hypothetical protein SAMN06295884_12712 [Bacillus sp. V-88]